MKLELLKSSRSGVRLEDNYNAFNMDVYLKLQGIEIPYQDPIKVSSIINDYNPQERNDKYIDYIIELMGLTELTSWVPYIRQYLNYTLGYNLPKYTNGLSRGVIRIGLIGIDVRFIIELVKNKSHYKRIGLKPFQKYGDLGPYTVAVLHGYTTMRSDIPHVQRRIDLVTELVTRIPFKVGSFNYTREVKDIVTALTMDVPLDIRYWCFGEDLVTKLNACGFSYRNQYMKYIEICGRYAKYPDLLKHYIQTIPIEMMVAFLSNEYRNKLTSTPNPNSLDGCVITDAFSVLLNPESYCGEEIQLISNLIPLTVFRGTKLWSDTERYINRGLYVSYSNIVEYSKAQAYIEWLQNEVFPPINKFILNDSIIKLVRWCANHRSWGDSHINITYKGVMMQIHAHSVISKLLSVKYDTSTLDINEKKTTPKEIIDLYLTHFGEQELIRISALRETKLPLFGGKLLQGLHQLTDGYELTNHANDMRNCSGHYAERLITNKEFIFGGIINNEPVTLHIGYRKDIPHTPTLEVIEVKTTANASVQTDTLTIISNWINSLNNDLPF